MNFKYLHPAGTKVSELRVRLQAEPEASDCAEQIKESWIEEPEEEVRPFLS